MSPSREAILDCARAGDRPRAAASRHRAADGSRHPDRRGRRRRRDRAHGCRLSASRQLPEAGRRSARSRCRRGTRRARVRRDVAGRARCADRAPPWRCDRALEGFVARPRHSRARGRERQGRRRQVDAVGQPRRGVRAARPAGRHSRRGRLRTLDPAHARDHAEAGARRPDDRAAGDAGSQADVDRLLPRRQRAGDVARPDAAPRARAVPDRRALGRARPARRRHAAGHGRRLDLARPAVAARGGGRRDDAAARGEGGRVARGGHGAEDEHAVDRRDREHDRRRLRARRRSRARGGARRAAPRRDPARSRGCASRATSALPSSRPSRARRPRARSSSSRRRSTARAAKRASAS